jgi:hypothetical protein
MTYLKNPDECKYVVPVNCDQCYNLFMKEKKQVNSNIKRGRKNFFCCNDCKNSHNKKFEDKKCINCDKIVKHPKIFCGSSCAALVNNAGRQITPEAREKQSESLRSFYKNIGDEPRLLRRSPYRIPYKIKCLLPSKEVLFLIKKENYDNNCKVCPHCLEPISFEKRKNNTCGSELCIHKALSLAHSRKDPKFARRSKDEIELFELCSEVWEVESNIIIHGGYDADIVLRDRKLAIMWDGPWHYKEMNGLTHSLKQVQNRDKYRDSKFSELGWTVLHYRDDHWTPKSAFQDIIRILSPN